MEESYEEELVTSDYYEGLTGSSYEINDSFSSDFDDDDTAVGLAIVGFIGIILLIVAAIALVKVIAQWKIFQKANRPGWAAIIPIYNSWITYEIVNMPGWFSLVGLIPLVGSIAQIVANIIAYVRLSKAFGKETAFSIGLIFLPVIFFPILGFDKSTYLGEEAAGEKLFK